MTEKVNVQMNHAGRFESRSPPKKEKVDSPKRVNFHTIRRTKPPARPYGRISRQFLLAVIVPSSSVTSPFSARSIVRIVEASML